MKLFRRNPTRARKILFLRKRYLAIPGAILVICALCLVINLPTYVTASTTDRQLPIYCVQRDYKVCSLTFDAAWGNAILRHMLITWMYSKKVDKYAKLVDKRRQRKEEAYVH